jgi:hypothetical protein
MSLINFIPLFGAAALMITLLTGCATSATTHRHALRKSLTFYASFDHGADADFARGDRAIYSAPNMKQPRAGTPGLPASGVISIAKGEGRFGDALRFHRKSSEMVFFRAKENVSYRPRDWGGTVSLWLRTSPQEDLAPGFCDPIQITPREWNDAAFFVEFEKRTNAIPFRLGAYADFKIWNPANRDWGSIPAQEKPLITVAQPPIARERWMHVVFTWDRFNTGQPEGVTRLYLNGEDQGVVASRLQTFTWDTEKALIMLGLNYVGYWDELAVFDRPLTAAEIGLLYQDSSKTVHAWLPRQALHKAND